LEFKLPREWEFFTKTRHFGDVHKFWYQAEFFWTD